MKEIKDKMYDLDVKAETVELQVEEVTEHQTFTPLT